MSVVFRQPKVILDGLSTVMRDQFPSDLATYKVIHIYFTRDGNPPRFSFADLDGKNPPIKWNILRSSSFVYLKMIINIVSFLVAKLR